jgi:hypothetical protein
VESFEGNGGARAGFEYERIGDVVPQDGTYVGEYFANRNLDGTPVLSRPDSAVDFDWGTGGPPSLPEDNFSVRWTRSLTLQDPGAYTFTTTSDDGVRLYIDGQLALDRWVNQGPTTYAVTRQLAAGTHQVVMEYYEATGGALARLRIGQAAAPPVAPQAFEAEYFAGMDLSGTPLLTRTDDAIDFDWGDGSPGAVVPANTFSARWTRTKTYSEGTYRFTITGDDGIRVLVDGTKVVDGWNYQAPTTYSADVALSAGEHTVVVEYFEHTGGAVAKFNESMLGALPPP